MTVLEEISQAVHTEKDPSESIQEYYIRLLKLSERLSDSEWDKLTEPAQTWINVCVDNLNEMGKVVRLPDPDNLDDPNDPVDIGEPSNQEEYPETEAEPAKAAVEEDNSDPEKFDRYGLRKTQNASKAARMFEMGVTMKEVRTATGGNHYNLLKKLEAEGHRVIKKKGKITLIPKAD